MRRLSDVLSDAKFEESMIFLEETIKKFKAKFEAPLEAHNPFDKVPSLVSVDNQEHSSDDEVVEKSEELSGLEDDDNDSSTAYETSIDVIGEEENDEMLVKLEENPVKDVSSNADDKVFDELPKPALTTTTSYKLLDDDFIVYSGLNSQTGAGATFDQVLGSYGDEARKLLNISTGIQLMEKVEGLFSAIHKDSGVAPKEKINGDMDSITQIDCLPRVFDPGISISFKDVRAAVIETTSLHNELFQPSIIATTCLKSNSGQCHSFATFLGQCKTISFTSNDMVIIFDPGGRKNGIHNLGSDQCSKVIEEYTAIAYLENPSSIVTKINKLDVEFWPKILMFVFDPGGSSWSHDIRDSLLFTDDKQHFDKSCGMAGSVLAVLRNGKVVLIVLSSWCIGRDSGTVVEVMVVYVERFLLSFTTYEYLTKAMVIWNLLVHIWRDKVAAFSKVKMAKSQYESTVSGYGLKASRSLIECCKETNLRVPGSTWKWVDFLACDAINKRSNAFELRYDRLHHDQFSAIKVNGICRQYIRWWLLALYGMWSILFLCV